MKKSLLTLAVLAASGAAMAQSSVTLYGIVDASFGQTKTGVGAASVTKTVLNSGEYSTSRWTWAADLKPISSWKPSWLLTRARALLPVVLIACLSLACLALSVPSISVASTTP